MPNLYSCNALVQFFIVTLMGVKCLPTCDPLAKYIFLQVSSNIYLVKYSYQKYIN